MIHPKISIVTPSYNQAQFLEATIQSILSQNYPNLEYIIIDGGSTDGSVEIIQKYEEQLHFWCSEPDEGQYDAINKGFAHSNGEIMAWLNSDDMYFPWTLRTVASIMSELPEVEWLTTLHPFTWDWHGFCLELDQVPGYSKESFLDNVGYIQQESTFWQRSLWNKAGKHISTKFKLAGDFDLWTSFYTFTELVGVTSPLGGFRKQMNQKTRQFESYCLEKQISLECLRDMLQWRPSLSRKLALHLQLNKIPKISTFSQPWYGYAGKRIVREAGDSPRSYWKLEEHMWN